MIMEILNICMRKGCKVWTIKENYRLGNDMQSKILAFALSLSAEIERNLISQRTSEALKLRKKQGKTLGRPKGKGIAPMKYKLYGKRKYINNALMNGMTKNEICKKLGVSRETLRRYLNGLNKGSDEINDDKKPDWKASLKHKILFIALKDYLARRTELFYKAYKIIAQALQDYCLRRAE